MHLIGLVESADHPCCRYRLAALEPFFRSAGHTLELRAIPRGPWARMRLWRGLAAADAVILQRRLFSWWNLFLIRRHARRLIYDFDDAVFQRDSYADTPASAVRLRRFIATVHAADLIVAGNHYLRKETLRFAAADRVHVVPTCVDPRQYPVAQHVAQDEGVRLVWIGSASTLQGLQRRRPLFDAVGRHVPGVKLRVICDKFPDFEVLPVESVWWGPATEAADLAAADIGVSWVPDDPWSRGKCGLKVLQYMAAGLPVVANPVGVQAEMVRHGDTGYLASTPDEWIAAIRQLAGNPGLRRRMGRAARQRVETKYSVGHAAGCWLDALAPGAGERAAA